MSESYLGYKIQTLFSVSVEFEISVQQINAMFD